MYYFYILQCKDKTFYCGYAKDLKSRETEHNSGKGSKYVTAKGGGKIIYSEKYETISQAMIREAEVKKWTRDKKLELILKSKLK